MKGSNRMQLLMITLIALTIALSGCKRYRSIRATSFDQVQMLKENVLLVRLKNAENKLRLLKKSGDAEEANKLRKKISDAHQETRDAFSKHFDFCEVYFFNAYDADDLRKKDFEEVQFYNAKMEEVGEEVIEGKDYLIASFSSTYADVISYTEKNNERHQVAGTNSRPALVVMDKDYIQLKKPFPYKVINISSKGYKNNSVKVLNENLANFYHRSVKKRRRY